MQQKQMNVELRSKAGKGISRQLRIKEMVPGVVYGKGMDPVSVSIKHRDLQAAMAGEGGQNNLITLVGGGSLDQSMAIIADLQRDVLKGTFKHVDLHQVNMSEKLRVTVPVVLKGTAAGVKEGGLLDFAHHELHVECLPGNIPDHIEINITELKIAQSIHVNEIPLPEGVKLLDNPKTPVVSILGRVKEEPVPGAAA
ncbi:MAG: 50S ribosomal protein L25/general stress protein Ctc [Desulfuromonadaceae bacterium GWB2_53_15]|nr:MAG: 50S ribosomal protein L25/general stress protein Ctc [Desulfuromonadales bacterium GWD2_54_10]OHB26065.1 MAG: 50S ribosomal protein L25/general stress protein Ctc [Desulfuromonadaceae bacterium GWB2_53_15]